MLIEYEKNKPEKRKPRISIVKVVNDPDLPQCVEESYSEIFWYSKCVKNKSNFELFMRQKWYFVTKIVLTYCEKNF